MPPPPLYRGETSREKVGAAGALDLFVDQHALAGVVDLLGRGAPLADEIGCGPPLPGLDLLQRDAGLAGGEPEGGETGQEEATAHVPMLHHRASVGDAAWRSAAAGSARMWRA